MIKKDNVILNILGDTKQSTRLIYEYDVLNAVIMHYSCRSNLIDHEDYVKLTTTLESLRASIKTLVAIGM